MLGSIAKPARLRLPDRPVGLARIVEAQSLQGQAQPAFKVAVARRERRVGERCGEQHDAEIGVLPDGLPRRLDRAPDALAHRKPRLPHDGRGGFGARHEVVDGHVVARGEAMHVAGLQRIELGKAGVKEAPGDLFGLGRPSQVPSWPSRRAGGSAASRNASTRWSEMRMWLTSCNPFQAGIELTSSTKNRPSRAWMISIPA